MCRFIILMFLTILGSSCIESEISEVQAKRLSQLEIENDSLRTILDEIDDKFVFDSLFIRTINNPNNTLKINSNYEMEILFLGYNPEKSYLVKYDSIVDGEKINADTIYQKNGTFKYATNLKSVENKIFIELNMTNQYGQSRKGTIVDLVRTRN